MATQTARALIARSLREIGALAAGETPTGTEASDGLLKLNELLEAWSLERLMVYAIAEVSHTLTAGDETYTIGSGGNINTARPERIENAVMREIGTNLDIPIRLLTRDEYAFISLKQTESTWARWLYNDEAYPLSTLTLWPVPSTSDKQLVLWLWQPLTAIATLDTSVNLPPGYSRALRLNLAMEMATEYGRPITGELLGLATAAKETIKAKKAEAVLQEMHFDPVLLGERGQYWDYRTGEYI